MLFELYTREKMRELDAEARARLPGRLAVAAPTPSARLLRATGRLLRRLGAGLEACGADPPPAGCCEACG